MHVYDLDTPALTVDLDVLERNIHNMAEKCLKLDIALRPHIKTHKIPEIAQQQIKSGAIGIACQKLGEAEVMSEAGIDNILIPYNIVGKPKLERLTRLAKRKTVVVAVDSEITANGVSQQAQEDGCTVGVIIELDTGGRRCGVQSPQEALELARKITQMPGIDFQGVMTYPSHVRAKPFIEETVDLLSKTGIPVNIISGGGTGCESASKEIGCTETRSGSYVYEGLTRVGPKTLNPETCALRMIVTIVSAPTSERVIVDGGQKTFTSYPPTPYGYIIEHPEIKIYGMSVEHGHIDVSASEHKFQVGEKLSVIPVHQGMTSNLHDELIGVRDGEVEMVWKIAGRGKIR
ncbi:MAG: alanine racemase [Candidatus Poribacteria bacterium]